jgi:tripartite ATP-independent transporter DctM subunit
LEKLASKLHDIVTPLALGLMLVARVVVGLMTLFITLDVVLRYFFNSPIAGSYELIEFMMVFVVFLGLSYTQVKKDHLAIDLFTNTLSERTMAVISSLTYSLSAGVFGLITWRLIDRALTEYEVGTVSTVLNIPLWMSYWVTVAGALILTISFLADLAESISEVIKKCENPLLWFAVDLALFFVVAGFPFWFDWLPWDITRPVVGIFGIVLMLLLLFSRMPIGPVMAMVGFLGFAYLVNWNPALSILGKSPFRTAASHSMSTIPLFMLMGLFCFHSELSTDIYNTVRAWMGRLRGGLAMSTVGACAGFAAVSGSSMATAVTMGTIALPEMKKYGYDDGLACGAVASGGSIGILIPPSVPFIIYASLSEQSIGSLFMAGVIPGILEALLYIITIYIICRINPSLGPKGPASTFKEKIVSLKGTWGILVLFSLVIGGIYFGIFTPTEAAGVGAFGALLLGLIKRKLTWNKILICLADATKNTSILFLMLIGANIFGYFLTMSQIPTLLADLIVGLPIPNALTIWMILLVYVVLGGIMPIMPAIILTVPVFLPVVESLGYSPIWFGVLVVTMAEIGQITPPVGINVFVLSSVAKDVSLSKIYKGIIPFITADVVRVILLFFIPALSLWLPSIMK